jgi:hypothetical protein
VSRRAVVAAGGVDVVVAALRRHGPADVDGWLDDGAGKKVLRAVVGRRAVRCRAAQSECTLAVRRHECSPPLFAVVSPPLLCRARCGTASTRCAIVRGASCALVQDFDGCRRHWLAVCDTVARGAACVTDDSHGSGRNEVGDCGERRTVMRRRRKTRHSSDGESHERGSAVAEDAAVRAALMDTVRVTVVGDMCSRPRVCASVYGGMVAMFLQCNK